LSRAMRLEFDDTGVFPRSILAPLVRAAIVKLKRAGGAPSSALDADVVANR
jgi:hypothetical protein